MKRSRRSSTQLIAEELEPRILYSGDLTPLVTEVGQVPAVSSSVAHITALSNAQFVQITQTTNQSETHDRHEIVFIDSGVEGYEALAKELTSDQTTGRTVDVVVIDANRDGVSQITAALDGRQDLDAIHIISHGESGEIKIGDTLLNSQTLLDNAVAVSKWGTSLCDDGDLLLYGCDVAAGINGRDFVSQLSQLTGADIEASTNLTGSTLLGGDWSLEYAIGRIETNLALTNYEQAQFKGVLATFTVTNTADAGAGSFRQAIIDANANAGTDTIAFSIGSGLATIAPTSALPDVTDTTIIDGTTQPGFTTAPIIELSGGSAGNTDGLRLTSSASNSIIRGLIINSFSFAGISLQAADNVTIEGNYIGTDSTGATAQGNGTQGILLDTDSDSNTVGGTTTAQRNIIAGNGEEGISVVSNTGNIILGNFIGVSVTGTVGIANGGDGIALFSSTNTTIGGAAAGSANVISGNVFEGIHFFSSNNNSVFGNYIGVDATGAVALGNDGAGIMLSSGSSNNTIGSAVAGAGNVISSNGLDGVSMFASSNNNTIQGNLIGLNAAGTAALGNSIDGVYIEDSSGTTIGGTGGAGNTISGNQSNGIEMVNSTSNTILGNFVGLNAAGTAAVGNVVSGIYTDSTSNNNTIGGTTTGQGNVISGNGASGVRIDGSSNNTLLGNLIGTNAAGNAGIANGLRGVHLSNGATGNTIGGTAAGSLNVISGNTVQGILLSSSDSNVILGNYIGLNVAGTGAIANGGSGINVTNSSNNTIGGATASARNVISGNSSSGVYIIGGANNSVFSNYIGLNVAGTAGIGNGNTGVRIESASSNNTIGGIGTGNVISSNTGNGVLIDGGSDNVLLGNFIGTNAAGTASIANGLNGVYIFDGSTGNTIGGTTAGQGNIISGNSSNGVSIDNSSNNTLLGNSIGTNAAGTGAIANALVGVYILNGSTGNAVGGTAAGSLNVISGNSQQGIVVDGSSTNSIQGNYIGLSATGTASVSNGLAGITLQNGADTNTVGGTSTSARNIVSGNGDVGIAISASDNNSILGNFVGTNVAGAGSIANANGGITLVGGSTGNTIGGSAAGSINVISGNGAEGIQINASSSNSILGNYIGLDAAGTAALNNNGYGIYILANSAGNVIGASGSGNVISGNSTHGVNIDGAGTGNTLQGNIIGLNAAGTASIANQWSGINIQGGSDNTVVGGTAAGEGNIISGNANAGILITSSSFTTVVGNYIGLNAAGTAAIGNGWMGVSLTTANNNDIGNGLAGAGNVISGNGQDGITVSGSATIVIKGNLIGTDAAGTASLSNAGLGIKILSAADTISIGGTTSLDRNVISGNTGNGIGIDNSSNVMIIGNYIGVNASGSAALGNGGSGIAIANASDTNTIGGTISGSANVISGNSGNGVLIDASTATSILGNFIGTDVLGTTGLANVGQGIRVANGTDNTTIGGTSTAARNIISGNGNSGIGIDASTNTTVLGNYIGIDTTGAVLLANGNDGITISNLASATTIGGTVAGSSNVISGNTGNGISITNSTSSTVLGNFIGINAAGTAALANSSQGIRIVGGSDTTVIGGTSTAARNIISGNADVGIAIDASTNTTVLGNYVGLNAVGSAAVGNGSNGIDISNGATATTVGGTAAGAGNVIAGNSLNGISINASSNNTVLGNYVGLNAAGTAAISNGNDGIYILNGSTNNTVGGSVAVSANIISGNTAYGIEIGASDSNNVLGNYIGLNAAGTAALGNGLSGIYLLNSANNTIGGTGAASRNVISGNAFNGVQLNTSINNAIQGNYIGTDAAGTASVANLNNGIYLLTNSTGNTIGGSTAGSGNLISGNSIYGIRLDTSNANSILGNYIGVNASGTAALSNGSSGIFLSGSNNSVIGGTVVGAGNLISGNGDSGIELDGSTGNSFLGNYIGVNVTGTASIANANTGILMSNSANTNTIGGTAAGSMNIISGNAIDGIQIDGSTGNSILGNYIGLNAAGTAAIGNGDSGIRLLNGANNTTIGGASAAARNVISGNVADGIKINASTGNSILGNYIGLNAAGTAAVGNNVGIRLENGADGNTIGAGNVVAGNANAGIYIDASSNNTIIGSYIGTDAAGAVAIANNIGIYINGGANHTMGGTTAGQGNVISGNTQDGIQIVGGSGHTIEGNYIGVNAAGTAAIANGRYGVYLNTGATGVSIGGATAGAGNVISGNVGNGIEVESSNANTILGNLIGLNALGTIAIANQGAGIKLLSSNNNTVGGTTTRARNVISGNSADGIEINASNGTTVLGNYIGINAAGTAAIANQGKGVYIRSGSTNNIIGGTIGTAGNVISGNVASGIEINGSNSNSVIGNYVGLDATGTTAIANQQQGIKLSNADNNTIGGTTTSSRNTVSGNANNGIEIATGSDSNTVIGNYIGTNVAGNAAVPNQTRGISIRSSSDNNVIGDNTGHGNLISGNATDGITIDASANTIVLGNLIGLDATGNAGLGNGGNGIQVRNASSGTQIGDGSVGGINVSSDNAFHGIRVDGSTGSLIIGNYLGTNATGSAAIGNHQDGLLLNNGASSTDVQINLISGNTAKGIEIGSSNNIYIYGNYIGTDINGTSAMGNSSDGINVNSGSNVVIDTNRIAFNTRAGINVLSATGVNITNNVITQNGNLGIDLGNNGVTANDTGDTDTGANNLQNFPVLMGATTNGTTIGIVGTFNGEANTTFRLEFFASASADSSGYGEGQRFLFFVNVTTDASGNATFVTSFTASTSAGEAITATATNTVTGDTSEFSAAIAARTAGVTVTPTSGLTTTEVGGTTSFQVVLNAAPISNVTITVASSNTNEGAVAPTTLTFTPFNWNVAQTVTVTGVQDFVTDGNTVYQAVLNAASSADTNYNGLNPADVSITNIEGANTSPVITVPSTQQINIVTPLVFSSANGNAVTVADADARNLQVTVSISNGTLTLSQTSGLTFSVGTGTRNQTMTFFGSITNINAALNGLRFEPTASGVGTTTFTISSNDLGSSGTGGAKQAANAVSIIVSSSQQPSTTPVTIPTTSDGGSTSPSTTSPLDSGSSSGGGTGADSNAGGTDNNGDKPNGTTRRTSGTVNSQLNFIANLLNVGGGNRDANGSNQSIASTVRSASITGEALPSFSFNNDSSADGRRHNGFLFDDIDSVVKSLLRKSAVGFVNAPLSAFGDSRSAINFGNEDGSDRKDRAKTFNLLSMETAEVTVALMSLGTVWMVAQKGALMASIVASVPAWQRVDPLPILVGKDDEEKENNKKRKREKRDKVDDIFNSITTKAKHAELEEEP